MEPSHLVRFALVLVLLAPAAASAESAAVREAIHHYEYGDYAAASRGLSEALALGIDDPAEKTRARKYLASAWHVQGELQRARKVIELLLTDDPTESVDAALFPPKFVAFFESVRAELPARPAPQAEVADSGKPAGAEAPISDKPLAQADPLPPPPPPPLVLTPPPPEPPSLALAFVPFGVGQFANGSPRKGAFFLTTEVVAFGAFAVALTAFESKKLPGSPGPFQCTNPNPCRFSDASVASRLETVYLTSLYTGLAITALGIADAIIENRSLAAESP
ncbi:MAG: hypothetical protein ACOX6T_02445 [Myxococcales bacterium]|jgi:hypothetical protein